MQTAITKQQKKIITIYAGNSYSAFRDNSLEKIESRAKAYIEKYNNNELYLDQHITLMIMQNVFAGKFKYNGQDIDDILKKVWLSIAIGFELTHMALKLPKFSLSIIRPFASPSIHDINFSEWVNKYKGELSAYIELLKDLNNLPDEFDIHKIIFE